MPLIVDRVPGHFLLSADLLVKKHYWYLKGLKKHGQKDFYNLICAALIVSKDLFPNADRYFSTRSWASAVTLL